MCPMGEKNLCVAMEEIWKQLKEDWLKSKGQTGKRCLNSQAAEGAIGAEIAADIGNRSAQIVYQSLLHQQLRSIPFVAELLARRQRDTHLNWFAAPSIPGNPLRLFSAKTGRRHERSTAR
jgi:hypothetical protein